MKRIVLAITLYISCMVVDYLVHYLNNRKKSSSPTTTQNSESYVVSCPASVKYVYMTIFALEIILFGVFLFLKQLQIPIPQQDIFDLRLFLPGSDCLL